MSRPPLNPHALRQAAMWQRLARQSRQWGDLEMARDAMHMAQRHLDQARAARGADSVPGDPRGEDTIPWVV